jgi:hypothetical protein
MMVYPYNIILSLWLTPVRRFSGQALFKMKDNTKGWLRMAIKEGRCPNCGSILHLDPAAEKGHCIFCDAVFTNRDAFEIAANPKGVVFPNTPQPKYEGPSLDPRTGSTAAVTGQRQKQNQQVAKKPKEVTPAYVVKPPVKMPNIKMSKQTKMRFLIGLLVTVAVITAIAVPLILTRDQGRRQLLDAMPAIAPFTIDVAKDVAIGQLSNDYLLIATDENATQADAVTLFKAYCVKRAAVYELEMTDFGNVYGPVTVKLVTPEGGWLIDHPRDMAALDSFSAVAKLLK